jgi:hypothetical protein
MEEELILTKDELKKLFADKKIKDTGKGWFYNDKEIEIIALHTVEPKYLLDLARAEYYKIKEK